MTTITEIVKTWTTGPLRAPVAYARLSCGHTVSVVFRPERLACDKCGAEREGWAQQTKENLGSMERRMRAALALADEWEVEASCWTVLEPKADCAEALRAVLRQENSDVAG